MAMLLRLLDDVVHAEALDAGGAGVDRGDVGRVRHVDHQWRAARRRARREALEIGAAEHRVG